MKAFWWFKENAVAGMARPGFNGIHWFDLPFEEALVYGWVGQRSCDNHPVESLQEHIVSYGKRIFHYFGMDEKAFQNVVDSFNDKKKMTAVFKTVVEKTKCIESFQIEDQHVSFKLCRSRLEWEMNFLKQKNIRRIVTLTENHNQQEILSPQFQLHHLAIDDLHAPNVDQVYELAEILQLARKNQEGVVVHCMAGIGRTTTMLMSAHLVLGESLQTLKSRIEKQNPSFHFSGSQWDFIQSVDRKIQAEGLS